jgi:hypothetical protein
VIQPIMGVKEATWTMLLNGLSIMVGLTPKLIIRTPVLMVPATQPRFGPSH